MKWAIYDQNCILEFMYSSRYTCQILIKLEFSRPVFEQYTNIKFHENPSSGSRIVPCGRTDMMKLIIAFRSLANAPKEAQICRHGDRKCRPCKWTIGI